MSHSSVFLFTRVDGASPEHKLVFQSGIVDQGETFAELRKVMEALGPRGRLYINVQKNALRLAIINRDLTFEMRSCTYDWSNGMVSKVFARTFRGDVLETCWSTIQTCRS